MSVLISIIMPALNEESKIEKALKSIRMQNVNQEEIEILVVDGGSKDRTREIALSYDARVLENPQVVPEEAKRLGMYACSGKYVVFVDTDEEFTDKDQLGKRVQLFQSGNKVKAVLNNTLRTPKGYPDLTRYDNCYGDPFTLFVYRFDREDTIRSLDRKRYTYESAGVEGRIYFIKRDGLMPVGDGATTMIDFEYYKDNFSDKLDTSDFIATLFDDIVNKKGCFGIVENDIVNHYTTAKFKTYLRKLKFRVITNVYPNENISGYTARAQSNSYLKMRKYLFLLYCLLPPVVLIDSAILAIQKKCAVFMLHFVFTYYTLFVIGFIVLKKLFGIGSANTSYGK